MTSGGAARAQPSVTHAILARHPRRHESGTSHGTGSAGMKAEPVTAEPVTASQDRLRGQLIIICAGRAAASRFQPPIRANLVRPGRLPAGPGVACNDCTCSGLGPKIAAVTADDPSRRGSDSCVKAEGTIHGGIKAGPGGGSLAHGLRPSFRFGHRPDLPERPPSRPSGQPRSTAVRPAPALRRGPGPAAGTAAFES